MTNEPTVHAVIRGATEQLMEKVKLQTLLGSLRLIPSLSLRLGADLILTLVPAILMGLPQRKRFHDW